MRCRHELWTDISRSASLHHGEAKRVRQTAVVLMHLRKINVQVETIYKAEHGELEHNLAEADEKVSSFDIDLEKV